MGLITEGVIVGVTLAAWLSFVLAMLYFTNKKANEPLSYKGMDVYRVKHAGGGNEIIVVIPRPSHVDLPAETLQPPPYESDF